MKPVAPQSVKLLCGILYSDPDLLEEAVQELELLAGKIDYRSDSILFDITDYYEPEMGSPIWRMFVSFTELFDPGDLPKLKTATNSIENRLAQGKKRLVNIDTGYLDYDKLVLASAKYNGQKIYLDQGIYADPTLHFRGGTFEPYPTAFPDFSDDRYYEFLLEIRRLYKVALRS